MHEQLSASGKVRYVTINDNLDLIKLMGKRAGEYSTNEIVDEWAEKLHLKGGVPAMFEFARANVSYNKDPIIMDTLRMPDVLLQRIAKNGFAQGDCIPITEKVIVIDKEGKYKIIEIGELKNSYRDYKALSYNFDAKKWEFQPILAYLDKGVKKVYEVKLRNGFSVKCTEEHELFVVERESYKYGDPRKYAIKKMKLSFLKDLFDYRRESAEEMNLAIAMAKKIPILNKIKINPNKAYIYGMYAAEGWAEKSHVCISQDDTTNMFKLSTALSKSNINYSKSKRNIHSYLSMKDSTLKEELKQFGSNSRNKCIPEWLFSANEEAIRKFMEGEIDGDAWKPSRTGHERARIIKSIVATTSDKLKDGIHFMDMLLGVTNSVYYQKNHQGAGKDITKRNIWRITEWKSEGKRSNYVEIVPGITKSPISEITEIQEQKTCDITIRGTHNFVLANGIIVHNCDCASLLLGTMLLNRGYPVRFVAAHIIGKNETKKDYQGINHVFLDYKDTDSKTKPNAWIPLEPSAQNKVPVGYQAPNCIRLYEVYPVVKGQIIDN